MRISLLIIFLHIFIYNGFAQSIMMQEPLDQRVNFGIKGGFNSSIYFVDKFSIGNVTINRVQNNYKVGYFGAFFMRINSKRHFVQPEVHYTISRSEIIFDKKGSEHYEIEPDYASINTTIRMIEFPILYGYNFIKNPPYGMCFFVGPKPKYMWNKRSELEFSNFDQQGIKEELRPINLSLMGGVGVTIANIFFDFTYEIGIHNISRSITYESVTLEEEDVAMVFNRRNSILSFSLGVFF